MAVERVREGERAAAVIAELIEKQFGIGLGLTAVGELLAKLGLTPQKPLQRAYQRDPEAIEKWQRETYPAIARQAKVQGAEVLFWDESGFRADTVHGKMYVDMSIPTRLAAASPCPERLIRRTFP